MLWLASEVKAGSETGMPSCLATAVAVGGINCISPRAPDGLRAPMSKLLSCRMIPRENAGSGGAAGLKGTGQPACGNASPSRPMRRATNTAPSGMPALNAKAAVERAFGDDRGQFVHARQEHAGALRVAPGDQPGGGAEDLVFGEGERRVLGPCRIAQLWRSGPPGSRPRASVASWP